MARLKRSSKVLQKAEHRCAALKSISVTLDLGNGLSLENYLLLIDSLRSQLDSYNKSLSMVDRAATTVQDTEQELRTLSERMLIAVAARYGKDSYEYEMAGGTRKSDRKRPIRRSPISQFEQDFRQFLVFLLPHESEGYNLPSFVLEGVISQILLGLRLA